MIAAHNNQQAETESRAERARRYASEVEAKIQEAIPAKASEALLCNPVGIRLLARRLSREANLQKQAGLIDAYYCKARGQVSASWSGGEVEAVTVQTSDTDLLREQIIADLEEAAAALDETGKNRVLRAIKRWGEHQHHNGGESGLNGPKTAKELHLPTEIDTPDARRVFGNALEAGFLEETSTGYRWAAGFHGSKAAAAYLCTKVYPYGGRPWGALSRFLGLTRLDIAAGQVEAGKNPPKWKPIIDGLFD